MAEIKARGDCNIYTGKVVEILKTKVSNNGFMRRTFAIAREGNHPDRYANRAFDLLRENCTIGDAMKVGEVVTIEADFYSNRYDGNGEPRYFHNIEARRVWSENGVEFKPVELKAKDWPSLLELGLKLGETRETLTERGKAYNARLGKATADYTPLDWNALALEVVAAHGGAAADAGADAVNEELPF